MRFSPPSHSASPFPVTVVATPATSFAATAFRVDPTTALLQRLLGISLGPITGPIGLTCSSISVVGVGGTSCSAQPACCTNNTFGGLLALGCNPINLNLEGIATV